MPEMTILDAIMFGHEEIKKIVAAIEEFRAEALALDLAKEKEMPELKVIPDPHGQHIRCIVHIHGKNCSHYLHIIPIALASGAVFCTYGDTAVLVTAVGAKEPKEGVDFLASCS